ncbi:hypothetical protein CJ030_MR8G008981 [Morella rubra]|uniref:Uncharacterized protein n=1 Tax=Morella rubra TaxID=262757 RepID=A0A6A1UPJ5_9ROSI|nr:hypothetical protein CJ030_MR8G008981 [Morella rubra]
MAYMVEALQLLTEGSSASASVQSTLVANQEVFKLDLRKLGADVSLLQKHFNLDEASSSSGPQAAAKDLLEDVPLEEEAVEEVDEKDGAVDEDAEDEAAASDEDAESDSSNDE